MMRKIFLISAFLLAVPSLWAEADLGRLVPLGFSVPAQRSPAPVLKAWHEGVRISLIPGERPTLIYFWGSHVPGSMADLPQLDELWGRLRSGPDDRDFLIAPVNLNDQASLVDTYAEGADLTLPLYLYPESEALRSYLLGSVPSLWLIDRNGRVAAACEGNVPWNHPDLLRSLREFVNE